MWSFWLVIILAILALATLPAYPYSRRWGYFPSGIVGLLLLCLCFLMWFGLIAVSWPWGAPPYPR